MRTDKPAIGMLLVLMAAAVALGYAVGWASTGSEEAAEAEPVTVQVPVSVTPEVCAEALAAGEDVMRLSAKALRIAQEAVKAAADLDVDEAEAQAELLAKVAPLMSKPVGAYEKLADKCRAHVAQS